MAKALGSIVCRGPECLREVAVTETAGGSLSCKCNWCGFSAYAPPGTKSSRRLRASIKPMDDDDDDTPAPVPAPIASPGPAPTPAPKPAKAPSSVFDLSQL